MNWSLPTLTSSGSQTLPLAHLNVFQSEGMREFEEEDAPVAQLEAGVSANELGGGGGGLVCDPFHP